MSTLRGIILAGGTGTRLWLVTQRLSKNPMSICVEQMIYCPLSVLMLMRIREIRIITTPHDQAQFQKPLAEGPEWGVQITLLVQSSPDGLAQAYLISEECLAGGPSAVVVGMGGDGRVTRIIVKPATPPSNYALTGPYFLDASTSEWARTIKPSKRGEPGIVTLVESYLTEGAPSIETMGLGFAWLDTGTHCSILDTAISVRTLQSRQGMQTDCPEKIAYGAGWIDGGALTTLAKRYAKTEYGAYLLGQMEN